MNTDLMISAPETRTIAVSSPDLQQKLDAIRVDIALARELSIDSPETLAEAQKVAGRISGVIADIERERKECVAPINALLKWLNDGYSEPQVYLQTLVNGVKQRLVAYDDEVRRQRAEAEERARREREEAARRAAELEAEARRRAAELEAEAKKTLAEGGEEAAAALSEQASEIIDAARQAVQQELVTAPAASVAPSVKGVRGKWSPTVTNKAALIRAVGERVAAGDESLANLLDVNKSNLDRLAAVQQNNLNLPGVRVDFIRSVSVRKAPL